MLGLIKVFYIPTWFPDILREAVEEDPCKINPIKDRLFPHTRVVPEPCLGLIKSSVFFHTWLLDLLLEATEEEAINLILSR